MYKNLTLENEEKFENTISNKKTFLTIAEVAAYSGYSVKYLYQMVHNRVLPFYKPRRKLFFKASEVDTWISNSRTKSIQEIQQDAIDSIC